MHQPKLYIAPQCSLLSADFLFTQSTECTWKCILAHIAVHGPCMWCGIPAVIPWEEIMMVTSLKRERWEYCSNIATVNKPAEVHVYSNATSSEVTSHGQQMCRDFCLNYHCVKILSDFFQLLLATISLNYSLNLCNLLIHGCVNQLKCYFFKDLYSVAQKRMHVF